MSHPARGPHSGIDGQTNAAQGRNGAHGMHEVLAEAERLSFMMDIRCIGRKARGNKIFGLSLADGPSVSTSVRPGRVRNRTKTEVDEKVKKPTDESRKKSPPARKAPARGRYVDEYARPAF